MNLRDMLISDNAHTILRSLGLLASDVGRYRDCWVKNGEIVIQTQNGGKNREQCQFFTDSLKDHPHYLRDQNEEGDDTLTVYFSIPEKAREALLALEEKEDEPIIATIKKALSIATDAKERDIRVATTELEGRYAAVLLVNRSSYSISDGKDRDGALRNLYKNVRDGIVHRVERFEQAVAMMPETP